MQQYFVNEILKNKKVIPIPFDFKHHIINVMRMKDGDCIRIVDSLNNVFLARILNDNLEIMEEILENNELNVKVTAFISLIKSERFELVLQKLTELGVYEIVALETKNSVVKIKDHDSKLKRWQKIVLNAARQSHRNTVPIFEKIISISNLKEFDADIKFFCYEKEFDNKVHFKKDFKKIGFIIGPEGGFDFDEVKNIMEFGFESVTLGKRILRAETAAIYLMSNIVGYYE